MSGRVYLEQLGAAPPTMRSPGAAYCVWEVQEGGYSPGGGQLSVDVCVKR